MTGSLPLLALLGAAAACGAGVARLRRCRDHWPAGRTAAAATGLSLLTVALLPPVATHDEQFLVHVTQHLLLASAAQLLLALSAPVTLALRTLPTAARPAMLGLVHSSLARIGTHPVVIVALNLGPLYGLYLTSIFETMQRHPLLHAAVHLHMIAAGCLLSWYLVGIDPLPRRGGLRTRLAVLVAVAGGHDVLAKLMYVHTLPATDSSADVRAGAQLMYYGGDAVELALLVVLLVQWYRSTGRELARTARRDQPVPISGR